MRASEYRKDPSVRFPERRCLAAVCCHRRGPSLSGTDSRVGLDAVTCPCQSTRSSGTHLAVVSSCYLPTYALSDWNPLSSGFKPVVPPLSSFASLTAVQTQSHFQGDLVTFPVCLVPVLFMLSVRSPMPPRPEPEVPRGWIKTSMLGQGEIPASASGATASGVSGLHVHHLYFLTPRKTRPRRDENMPGTVTERTRGRARLSPELAFKIFGIQN